MRSFLPVLSLLVLELAADVRALVFDIQVRQRAPRSLAARANGDHTIPVANTRNSEYIANITLGGREIPVLLDTGSSDLWVTGAVPGAKDLGKGVSLSYAVGRAVGDVWTAPLEFANYTVPDQAFLLVPNASTFSIDIKAQGFEGLIGLGPNSGSVIRDEIGKDNADSILNRIFSQNSTEASYLTMMLNRLQDPDSPPTGQMTISEVLPQYSNITSMPKLPIEKVHRLTDEDQHWQVYTDVNGVIGPDGKPIEVESIVPKAPDGQLMVVIDSGFTLPQVPRAMADAIYGRVQGAEYNVQSEVWTVPCDQLLTVTFKFGGIEFPIHPLDMTSSDFNMINSLGQPACLGTFQPITSAFSLLGEYDIILGMSFMRNAYTLLDYGNFMHNTANDRGDPFIQMLPLTDPQKAHEDFVQVRMDGVDTSGDPEHALLPPDQMQHSPISEEEKKKRYQEMILSRWPYIFVGCFAFVLICLGLVIWRCCVARRRRREAKAARMRLPDSTARSPNPTQVSFQNLENGEYGMRESKGYRNQDYRPSFDSNRMRV